MNPKIIEMFIKRINITLFYCAFFISAVGVLLSLYSCASKLQADMIVHHAKIYTVDSGFSVVEAMVIKEKKIIATGTSKDMLDKYQSGNIIDAQGKTIYPGFIDAHCHFTGYATDMWKCDLTGTKSFDDVITKLVDYSKNAAMQWLYGRGWDQNDWTVKEFPDKKILDSLFPERPVFLKRIDGHAALVNQKALDLAGVTANTKIAGGSIEVRNGKLTGILVDNAMDLVDTKIPVPDDQLTKKYFNEAQAVCFALGLTGVHDCGIGEHIMDLVDEEQKAGKLKMKIFALLSDSIQYYDKWIKRGPYITDRLHMGGFKIYADGALGSRGACLLEDYTDKPGWKGFLLKDAAYYTSIAQKLAGSQLQMCTHAIGDSGNREMLHLYASVLKGKNDRRWRIEHAQVVNENDFSLFGDYSIIPSVQPTHATSDMYWADKRLGSIRVKNAYAYKKLLKENGWLPLGTDFPVEYIDPLKTFYAAVVRKDASGYPATGFQTENALTREEALRGMTIWAAKAAFEEKQKGSLVPGMDADFIMLDTDLMNCPVNGILKTKVLATYIYGEKVYGK